MKPSLNQPFDIRRLVRALALAFGAAVACGVTDLHAGTRLVVGGARGMAGTTVSIPVILRSDANVVALQADVLFNTNSLSAGSVTAGAVSANHVVASSRPTAGVQRLLLYSLNNKVLSNGVLANLSFTVAPGSYPEALRLAVTNVMLVTASATPVLSTNVPGVIVINPVVIHPAGDVNFFLTVVPNESYMVQGSVDMVQWLDLGLVETPSAIIEFTDTNAQVFPYRFYRAVATPQP
jgi:hypothetical protein